MTFANLSELDAALVDCRACPRLVSWREQVAREKRAAYRDEEYWGRPVPGFGPADAPLLIVGLAPAAHGGNRTGRMFTGDRSGDVLYAALYAAGLANQPTSVRKGDGLELYGTRITAPVHCAPPDNKPTPDERDRCGRWLAAELDLLAPTLRAVVVLGAFGWQALLPVLARAGWVVPRPRPAVRARRAGHVRAGHPRSRAAAAVRQLPREPAEHLHRTAHPRHAGGGAGSGGAGRRRRPSLRGRRMSACTTCGNEEVRDATGRRVLVAGNHPHAVYLKGTVLGVRGTGRTRTAAGRARAGKRRCERCKRSTGRLGRSSARPAGTVARAAEPVRCSGTPERGGVTRWAEQWCVSHCVVTGHSSPNTTGRWSSYMETCTTCNGDGRCLSCGGSGTVGTWITHRCDTCHGRRVCGRCSGSGEVKKRSR